ncbi:MAG TPA: M48 family metallopeptidase, partial [Gemmatimonadales bacterium]|nr:M48 family metallopeptidase [Gemmatimonadales bacterium]
MHTPHGSAAPSSALVNPRERALYALMLAVSLLVYGAFVLTALATPEIGLTVVFYGVLFALIGFMAHALGLGHVRGSAIRVSERQFPLLHRLAATHARRLGLAEVPALYVVESGGLLNAFATRFLGRDFVVVHSDVLELALQRGEAAVGFIVAHELGHVWRGHLKHRWLIAPARFIPYLGSAYSRACEYTCDRVGAHCQPDGAVNGLLALAAGKQLFGHVNVREFAAQATSDSGFWV